VRVQVVEDEGVAMTVLAEFLHVRMIGRPIGMAMGNLHRGFRRPGPSGARTPPQ
jgi:hypothetical protein